MSMTLKSLTIDLVLHDGQISLQAHGIGPGHLTRLHDDPQAAWDYLAAQVGPQIVAAAQDALKALPDDI